MTLPPNPARRTLLGAALAALLTPPAFAQGYPSGPVKLIVPFTPGSATDVLARIFGERMAASLGQAVLVENRPGAGGTIGAAIVAKSPPDGLTLAVVATGHVVNPVLFKDLPYDTLKDFAAIAPLGSYPNVLVTAPATGIKSVQELIAQARARPGVFNYCTAGIGSAAHINSQKLIAATGIEATHIPLKGAGEILSETMSGRCQFSWAPLVSSLGAVKSGKLVALAMSSAARSAAMPDVPTIAEAGVPGAEFTFWVGLLAPAGTPRDIVSRLNAEVLKAAQSPELKQRLTTLGAEPMPMSPAEFDAMLRRDYETLGRVMRGAAKT
ncbi:MAG TPA: tripartite tricarboxylate transporter substrate binding protein [Burkholderiales bacterium]|jgi:tripartite-type tricarboxylate transporter receptor subunit TctC